MVTKTAPYGSWKSPISSHLLAESNLRFGQIDVDNDVYYYIEGRPSEKGRCALMRGAEELLPKEFNVKTTVHEYGGKCFLGSKGSVYFVNHEDQDIYKITKEGVISRITKDPSLRFADFTITEDSSFLYAVAERHSEDTVDNMLVCIDLKHLTIAIIASGYDFYAAPRISPNGLHLAWFFWNHPNMPWDGTELWVADLSLDGTLINPRYIAGGVEESITAPLWSDSNVLHFISDATGWWNLYLYSNNSIEALYPCEIDFGAPHWIFGSERYCFLQNGKIAAIGTSKGQEALYILDGNKHSLERIETPFTSISDLYLFDKTKLLFIAGSPSIPTSLVSFDLETKQILFLKSSQNTFVEKDYISIPEEISYGFYYPPTNKYYQGKDGEKPPLIIRCHGGPTVHVAPRFSLDILYFTSRGFAFFEINYAGSSGYGREYRNRLKGKWGILDVQDCVHSASELCKRGLADENRLIIKGSSAGGYTALSALTFTNVFQAGASYYGISDLEALVKDTHKLELHYLDSLVGPYPQDKATYVSRSPIHFVDKVSSPIIFFQGAKDKVVSPSQSETMYLALSKKQIPTEYLLFKNESHGFKIGATFKECIEAELSFYSKILHLSASLD